MIFHSIKKIFFFYVIALLTSIYIVGCGGGKVSTGPFKDLGQLEINLKRGVSTKADVQSLLGEPNGYGHSYLPALGEHKPKPHEVWYYEDIESGDAESKQKVIIMEIRQQILVIFFDQDKYDGFMWFTNAGKGSVYKQ
jgi:hypothetical protein